MGYLLDYEFGVVFSFGIFVCNTFVPESTTYIFEIMQQLLFTYPFLTLLVCRMRGGRAHYHLRRQKSCPRRWCGCVFCCTALSRRHRELLVMC
uniref:Transmembrane protein 62 n=1 Tax=Mesocestoides corti TaxID=53468 RepID=A0A5K3G1N6_MESCO